jgi:hypothetical protein
MFAHRSGGKIQPHSFAPNAATLLKTIGTRFLYFSCISPVNQTGPKTVQTSDKKAVQTSN